MTRHYADARERRLKKEKERQYTLHRFSLEVYERKKTDLENARRRQVELLH